MINATKALAYKIYGDYHIRSVFCLFSAVIKLITSRNCLGVLQYSDASDISFKEGTVRFRINYH